MNIKNKVLCGSALVNKRRYCLRYIYGKNIKTCFTDKGVGSVDALCGDLESFHFPVFVVKEEDYTLMLMFTYEENERVGEKFRTIGGEGVTFKCPETVHNHYQHRDAVESYNVRHQAPFALDEEWYIRRRDIFAFLLALL